MKKAVFYTFVSDDYYEPIGTPKLINSFKKFHPDIDLIIFRQDIVDAMFKKYDLNWLIAKPYFARLLVGDYDMIVNIDADTIILDRLSEVIDGDYDIGCVTNFNKFENTSVENVTEEMFLQAGLVASRKPEFWDYWIEYNKKAMDYKCKENDTLNLLWYNDKRLKDWKKEIFDKDKNYLGCKSLGQEKDMYLKNNKVMIGTEIVKAYHHAKGPQALPKLDFDNMEFVDSVKGWMKWLSNYGTTEKYGAI